MKRAGMTLVELISTGQRDGGPRMVGTKVGFRTGLWLGELTHFWDVAEKAGFQMDIAIPSGGYVRSTSTVASAWPLMWRGG